MLITVDAASLSEVFVQINESEKARFECASSSAAQTTASSSNQPVAAHQYSISDLISLVDPDDPDNQMEVATSTSEQTVSLDDCSDLEKLLLQKKKNLLVSSLLG